MTLDPRTPKKGCPKQESQGETFQCQTNNTPKLGKNPKTSKVTASLCNGKRVPIPHKVSTEYHISALAYMTHSSRKTKKYWAKKQPIA